MQYSSGTRGFLEWTRDNLPWVYEEYSKRDVTGGGLNGFDYAYAGRHYMEGGTMGPSGLGDVATDSSGTTYYGDTSDNFDSSAVTSPSSSSPAAAAPASPTTSSQAGIFSQLATAVGGFLLTKQQLDTQNKIVNVQLQRAQQGLPPLNINTLQAGLPTPTLNFGLASGTQNMVLLAALGLGALFVLPKLFGGRR